MKIGIVAGEKSGDYLGAELIKAINKRYPGSEFIGLCGPLMQAEGAVSLAEMDKISIMGLAGAIKGLFEILSIRKKVRTHMLEWQPDVFIGIDVPDFNLSLELKLKHAGIPTVHYVSPTVWAWRGKRIKKIKSAVSLMLTLFPFEEVFYRKHKMPVKFVGHPLAKQVLDWQIEDSVKGLVFPQHADSKKLLAILPGSRMSEVTRLAPIMLEACQRLSSRDSNLDFVIPAASDKIYNYLHEALSVSNTPVRVIKGHSRDALAMCHLSVLASGTAALEAALFGKPMVVMYKVSTLNKWYAAQTMVVEHFSMPNHLTGSPVVPELIQEAATVENLLSEAGKLLEDQSHYQAMRDELLKIAPLLNEDSSELACKAIESVTATGRVT